MKPAEKTKEQLVLELQVLAREHEELEQLYRMDHSERLKAEAALRESEANLSAIFSREITDRKNAENARAVCENLLELALAGSGLGIWTLNVKTMSGTVDKRAAQILGYAVEDIPEQTIGWDNLSHPDDIQKIAESLNAHIQGRIPIFESVHRMRHVSGEYIWILGRGKISHYDIDGTPLQISGTLLDITSRKRSEEELSNTKWRMECIIQAANIGTWEWNVQTGETTINAKWAEIIGYSKSELEPVSINTWYLLVHPSDLEQSQEIFHKHFAGEIPFYQCECRMKHKDGHWVWILDSGQIVTWSKNGQPLMMFGTHIDITERKRSETEQQEALARHSSMIANISDVIGIVGPDGLLKYKSPNIEKWFGWNPRDLIGTNGWLLIHPDDLCVLQAKFVSLLEEERSVKPVMLRYKCKDGSYKPIEMTAINLMDDPAINGVLLNYHDITARKAAEDLLAQTRQNYETFFNTIDDFLFILDEQGNMVHVNSTVIDRLGYTWEELSGKSILMVHPPDRQAEAGRIVGETLQGIVEFCPVPLVTKQGTQIPVETRAKHGIWDGKAAIFGVTKDISRIQLSEEKFSKLFHLNPSACSLSDLETDKFIEVNEAFYTLFGFDKNEVIGKTPFDLGIISVEAAKAFNIFADSKGRITNAEVSLKAKNGEIRHVLLSAENIYVQENNYRFTVVRDITGRKKAEEALQKSEAELRKLNATKDKFFSIIAHDLRGPFNGFLGLTKIMVEELPSLSIEDVQGMAIDMKKSASNLFRLLENLLHWARVQQGQIPFEPKFWDLLPLVNDSIEMIQQTATNKDIEIDNQIPDGLMVFADKNILQTVVRNLVSNSIKFSNRGGKISLSAKAREDKNSEMAIKDNGIGMDKELIDKLFLLDAKTGRKGTEGESSTGLGLLLCKEFVEKFGGKIWAESEKEKGSIFYFTIPIV